MNAGRRGLFLPGISWRFLTGCFPRAPLVVRPVHCQRMYVNVNNHVNKKKEYHVPRSISVSCKAYWQCNFNVITLGVKDLYFT